MADKAIQKAKNSGVNARKIYPAKAGAKATKNAQKD